MRFVLFCDFVCFCWCFCCFVFCVFVGFLVLFLCCCVYLFFGCLLSVFVECVCVSILKAVSCHFCICQRLWGVFLAFE